MELNSDFNKSVFVLFWWSECMNGVLMYCFAVNTSTTISHTNHNGELSAMLLCRGNPRCFSVDLVDGVFYRSDDGFGRKAVGMTSILIYLLFTELRMFSSSAGSQNRNINT